MPCRVKGAPDKYSAPRFFAGKAEVRSDRRFTRKKKIVSRFGTFDTTHDRDPDSAHSHYSCTELDMISREQWRFRRVLLEFPVVN